MIRLTHRRCRTETAALDAEVESLTELAETLTDDLRAAEQGLDEVVAACRDLEYGVTEAVIPDAVRSRLAEADRLPEVQARLDQAQEENARLVRERDDQREALLVAAHEAGTLARTYALMEGAGMSTDEGLAGWLLCAQFTSWTDLPDWGCQDTGCSRSRRELVWHPDTPDQAHLACECGRVWPTRPGTAQRAERETRAHRSQGTHNPFQRRWSHSPAPVLEALDRALPTPTQLRERDLAA
jgi:hypothetical protein